MTPHLVGPTTGARGMPISFERGATSKDRLHIDWLHPVPPNQSENETSAAGPLPLMEALQVLWGQGDDRPLLVLRECNECAGSDDALLNRSINNDRTMLLTKWFRTVRLPPHIVQASHPFYNVFADQDYSTAKGLGGFLPHVFLMSDPSARPVFFSGTQTPADLQKGLIDMLEQRYAKNPQKALKAWMSLLDKFDTIDADHRRLEDQLAEARATDGPDSTKAKKLTAQLERNTKDREEALDQEAKVRDLGLLPMSRKAFATAEVAAAK